MARPERTYLLGRVPALAHWFSPRRSRTTSPASPLIDPSAATPWTARPPGPWKRRSIPLSPPTVVLRVVELPTDGVSDRVLG